MRTVNLTIDRLAYGPAGVGRTGGKVVFVPGTVPGDEVEVVLDEEKKNYATGHVLTLQRPSPQRRTPPCPYVPRCGGCPWQHVAYAEQLRAKEDIVRAQMRRIGGISAPPISPIIPSPQEWHYRHRIRLRVEENARLGFYQATSHELVEIESCLIAGEDINSALREARAWLPTLRTIVRRVELITSEPEHGVVLVGNAEGGFQAEDEARCTDFLQAHPTISGLMLFGRGWRKVWGDSRITLGLDNDGQTLGVSPGVFTQVNLAGNRTLIATLLQVGKFQEEQRVIELYCGAGNLSIPIASRVKKLIGVEHDQVAIADARANATRAGLTNTRFVCASASAGVQDLLRNGVRSDVIVLDPPRAGAPEVIDAISRLGAQKVLFVSCDPATLARDLRRLSTHGYHTQLIQPLDLFPHTYHVETISLSVLTC